MLVLKVPPLGVAVAVSTSELAALKMCTTTGSVGSLALPLKVGLVFFDGVVGPSRLTVGEAVTTANETVSLSFVSSGSSGTGFAGLVCVACALYSPSLSASLSGTVTDHSPKAGGVSVVTVRTGLPLWKMWTVTSDSS